MIFFYCFFCCFLFFCNFTPDSQSHKSLDTFQTRLLPPTVLMTTFIESQTFDLITKKLVKQAMDRKNESHYI